MHELPGWPQFIVSSWCLQLLRLNHGFGFNRRRFRVELLCLLAELILILGWELRHQCHVSAVLSSSIAQLHRCCLERFGLKKGVRSSSATPEIGVVSPRADYPKLWELIAIW